MFFFLRAALMWFLGPLLRALGWLVGSSAGRWVASILLFFGVQIAVNTVVVQPLIDYVVNQWSGVPGFLANAAAFIKVPQAMSIILSAYATKASIASGKLSLMRAPGH